jgi:hypothetical protein
MRRASLSWVLSLLLVFAQHGAVLHELGHLSHDHRAAGAVLREQPAGLDAAGCPTCEAFAQIGNPMAAAASAVVACPAAAPAPADPRYAVVCSAAPTPRSRGPPQV